MNSIENNKLVVFAGAGVSMGHPTNLPNFNDLTSEVARGAYKKFDPNNDTPERFLGELESDCVPVQKMASDALNKHDLQPNKYHQNIVDLFLKNDIRIITTNYDLMFEETCEEFTLETQTYTNPAFPRGDNFSGIVHLHGDVKDYQNMVLTDGDFGRAYMLHGEASKFLSQLFNSDYTVLFVGYSYNDPVLRYFTKALPDLSGEKWYIFSDKNEKTTHERLGLTPIIYEPGNYEKLYNTIKKLGEFSNRTTFSWKERIVEISLINISEIESTTNDEIKYIFKKKYLLEQFLNEINEAYWFNYLYENNYFNFLFSEKDMSQSELLIMNWILNKFIKDNCEEIILMLLKHNNAIREKFNRSLLQILSRKTIEKEALKKILNIVDYTIDPYISYQLIEKLNSYSDFDKEIVVLFQKTLSFEYSFVKPHIRDSENEFEVRIHINSELVNEIWKMINTKNINYEILAETVTNELADLEKKSIIGKVEHNFSPYNSFLDNSGYVNENTHYIKFFIELLKKIKDTTPNYIKNWTLIHIDSDLSILRRISIYLLNYFDIITDIEKIDLIKNKIGIFSGFEKEEIFSVLKTVFPRLNIEQQDILIKHIMSYNFENKNNIEEHDFKRTINYSRFNMLVWLKRFDENNELVLSSIKEIKKIYPKFEERDYPDRNFWPIESGFANQNIQVTPEFFLTNNVNDYFNKLLKYEGDGFEKADRNAYLGILSDAIGKEFNLGIELSNKLMKIKNYNTDLWHYILRGFEKNSIDSKKFILICNTLSSEIIKNYTYDVAKILENYSSSITIDEYNNSKEKIYKIIDAVLAHSKPFEGNDTIGWVDRALNTSYGVVTEALVKFIIILNKNKDKNDYYINKKLKFYIDSIMNNPESGEAQTVLYSYYNNLNLLDSKWVDENLVPNFVSANDDNFNISWQGYLRDSRIDAKRIQKLENEFLFGIKNINRMSDENCKEIFIQRYTIMCVYFVEDPLLTYIPYLYEYSLDYISTFYNYLKYIIKNQKKEKKESIWLKWLKKFIKNRINNIPVPYQTNESYWILSILTSYYFVFNDVENIVDSMKRELEVPIKYLYELKDIEINNETVNTVQLILTFCLRSVFEDEEEMIDGLSKTVVIDIMSNILGKNYELNEDLVEITKKLNIDFMN